MEGHEHLVRDWGLKTGALTMGRDIPDFGGWVVVACTASHLQLGRDKLM